MQLRVYVPSADALSPAPRGHAYSLDSIAEGSGIVGTPGAGLEGDRRVKIDYEGGIYNQPYFASYANRVFHAAGRHTTNYPTVARAVVPEDALLLVGWFDTETRTVRVDNSEALASWLGTRDYDDQLQATS